MFFTLLLLLSVISATTYDSDQTCKCTEIQTHSGTTLCTRWECDGKLKEKEIACFSLDTSVPTPDGIKMMGDIQTGDKVYSLNLDTGKVVVDIVYDFFHYEPQVQVDTLQFTTNNGIVFWITPRHIVFFDNGTSTFAENVQVGDCLRAPYQECDPENNAVVDITTQTKEGFIAPATSTGTILVGSHYNSVAVSVYAETEYTTMAHYWSWPLRLYRRWFGYPKRQPGMNTYASWSAEYVPQYTTTTDDDSMTVLEKKVMDITPILN